MEATLKFNLPEDNTEFVAATQAMKMRIILWDMDQWLRAQTKYAPDTMSEDMYRAYEDCREKLWALMNRDGVNFED